jgi:hypothetical protein
MTKAGYRGRWLTFVLGGAGLLLAGVPAWAQGTGSTAGSGGSFLGSSGSTGGSSATGSFLGSSGGTGTGSSSSGVGSFTGTTGTTGTFNGTAGGYNGTASRGTGSTRGTGTASIFPQDPSTSNPFQATYFNPLALGQSITSTTSMLGTTVSPTAFGQPSLGTSTSVTTTTGRGGTATTSTTASGFTTVGVDRSPPFVTALGFAASRPAPALLAASAARALARSSALPSRDGIRVNVTGDGETVILDGAVADERQRRLAEALVRMTPGVHQVLNRLQVRPAPLTTAQR